MEDLFTQCPACREKPDNIEFGGVGRKAFNRISCPQCGQYMVSRVVMLNIAGVESHDPLIRNKLRRYLYEQQGSDEVLVLQSEPARGDLDDWSGPIVSLQSLTNMYEEETSPLETYESSILRMESRSKGFGHWFDWTTDRFVIPALTDREAGEIVYALRDEGMVSISTLPGMPIKFTLTPQGFRRADDLRRKKAPSRVTGESAKSSHAPTVFLSHSHVDNGFVERLATDLESHGIKVWYDGWDLDIGHDLTVKIQKGISESDYLALILSPAAVESVWVQREWTAAFHRELIERRIVILPILYRDCQKPVFLQDKLHADFRNEHDYYENLNRLVRQLRGESKRPQREARGGA